MTTTTTTLAWFNDPALKAEVSARMLQHRIEDGIIQGHYQLLAPELASKYKGCLIGCTLPLGKPRPATRCGCGCGEMIQGMAISQDWHKEVEKRYGIPEVLNHVFDNLFESLPTSRAAWFAVSTIEAIPVGADLSEVAELFHQDLVAQAKRSRKSLYAYPERDHSEWLKWELGNLLSEYTFSVARKKAVELAEKLLERLANAPVPNPPTKEDAAEHLLDEILRETETKEINV